MERDNDFFDNTPDEEVVDDFWAGFEAAKKAAEEEAARIAEERAEKKAAEEAARLEAERKAEAEAARLAAIEAAKKAAEDAKALAEKAAAEAEAARLAEEETKKKTAEEAARRIAEEEAAKKAAEEEAARKIAEEEAAKKAEEEAAKKAAAEAKKAAKKAEAEAKALAKEKEAEKKKAKKVKKAKNTADSSADGKGLGQQFNFKALVISAVICLVVLVAVFFGSKSLFGESGPQSGTASEEAAIVEQEITAALQAANVGLSFNVYGERLSIANKDGYVVYFKDQYTLYKATGTYSKNGLSNVEMINEAKSVDVSAENAQMISSCVTSYYVNTKEISNKVVTLNVRITDNEAQEAVVGKDVSVNVASSTAAVLEEAETETE